MLTESRGTTVVFGGLVGVCALSVTPAPANDATNTIALVSFIFGLPGMTGNEWKVLYNFDTRSPRRVPLLLIRGVVLCAARCCARSLERPRLVMPARDPSAANPACSAAANVD